MKKTIIMILAVILGQLVMADNNIHLVKDTPGLDPDDEPRDSIADCGERLCKSDGI